MKEIKLKAKTNKAKQVLKQCGDSWFVIKEKDKVAFSTETGPWLYIDCFGSDKPLSVTSRWVHSKFDKNFEVVNV